MVFVPKKSHIIEDTALQFAAIYYEAGRSTGLTSKYKNAREFAKNNVEKFVPKVVQHFIEILNNPTFPKDAKEEIFQALMERHNDPTLKTGNELPDIDVKKLIDIVELNKGAPSMEANLTAIAAIDKAIAASKPKPKGH